MLSAVLSSNWYPLLWTTPAFFVGIPDSMAIMDPSTGNYTFRNFWCHFKATTVLPRKHTPSRWSTKQSLEDYWSHALFFSFLFWWPLIQLTAHANSFKPAWKKWFRNKSRLSWISVPGFWKAQQLNWSLIWICARLLVALPVLHYVLKDAQQMRGRDLYDESEWRALALAVPDQRGNAH